jgi:hypothetical protein
MHSSIALHKHWEHPARGAGFLPGCWSGAFAVLIASLLCARAAQPAAMPHLDEVASVKSVFVDDPKFGKDPFFPKSDRRKPQVIVPVATGPDTSALAQLLNNIVLKGISGVPGKRLAMLNNRTLEAGEQFDFKLNGQAVRVRCVEIREKSVIIGIDGTPETKEIHLRAGM